MFCSITRYLFPRFASLITSYADGIWLMPFSLIILRTVLLFRFLFQEQDGHAGLIFKIVCCIMVLSHTSLIWMDTILSAGFPQVRKARSAGLLLPSGHVSRISFAFSQSAALQQPALFHIRDSAVWHWLNTDDVFACSVAKLTKLLCCVLYGIVLHQSAVDLFYVK